MLAGSVAVHLLALVALWWVQPSATEQEPAAAANEVSMVFEAPGSTQVSIPSPNPAPAPAVAQGNPNSTNTQPSQETTAPSNAPPPPPDPLPPTPPAQVASLEQAPPQPEPPAAAEQPPQPLQPPAEPPQPIPTPSQEPPSVYLHEDTAPALRPLPRFVMPQPPPPLPALPPAPRPAPPRRFARPTPSPQNPFAAPQDWSLNAGPPSSAPSRSARGFDLSTSPTGSQSSSNFSYVAGARPTGDWLSAFRRWAQARVYYPEEAAREGQDGVAVVMVEVERSGHVRSVRLESSARSPFLDGALVDLFRNANVPPVTSDMPDPVTMMRVQLTYHLIRH